MFLWYLQFFLKRFLVFLILLFSSISLHCSFKEAFLSLLAILWKSEFSWVYLSLSPLPFTSLLSSAICKVLLFFSLLLVTYSLQPHRLQQARLLCPLLSIFQSFLKFMYIESVMPFNHLILCCPCLLLPSIFPSIRVFSNESAFRIR